MALRYLGSEDAKPNAFSRVPRAERISFDLVAPIIRPSTL